MILVESFAVIFSLISVILTMVNKIYCWPIGIIGILLYSILFFQNNLYSNLLLQFVFLIQSIIAWKIWNKSDENKITRINKHKYNSILYITILLFLVFLSYNYVLNGQSILLDSLSSATSIVAIMLTSKRKIESWIFWAITDILLVIMFLINGLCLSSIIYIVFLLLTIKGFLNWFKIMKNEKI